MELLIYDEFNGEHREITSREDAINLPALIDTHGDSYDIYVKIGNVMLNKREDDNEDYITVGAEFTPAPMPSINTYPTFNHIRNDIAAQTAQLSQTFATEANNHQFNMEINLAPQDDIEVQFGVDITTDEQPESEDAIEIEFHKLDGPCVLQGNSAYAPHQQIAARDQTEAQQKRRNHL